MCPDHDDPFRRTITPAAGPNVDGAMQQIVDTHTRVTDETAPVPVPATERAARAIEPSMPAVDQPER